METLVHNNDKFTSMSDRHRKTHNVHTAQIIIQMEEIAWYLDCFIQYPCIQDVLVLLKNTDEIILFLESVKDLYYGDSTQEVKNNVFEYSKYLLEKYRDTISLNRGIIREYKIDNLL